MLLPRYSLRWLLWLTTASAGVSLVLSYAVRGQPWALGVIAGLWSFVVLALFYAAAFLAAWMITRTFGLRSVRQRQPAPGQTVAAGLKPEIATPLPELAAHAQVADSPPPMTG